MFYDIALSLYLLALLHAVLYFFLGYENLTKVTNGFVAIGLVFNIIFTFIFCKNTGGIASNLAGIFQLLTGALALGYLLIFLKYKKASLALFILPVIVLIGAFTYSLKNIAVLHNESKSFWLYIHLPFTILGSAFFMIAAIVGLMYVIQDRQLKKKSFGMVFHRFPPVNVLNQLNTTALAVGFSFFTIGLIAGVVWGLIEWSGTLIFTPKLIFAVITWVIFGIILVIKYTKGLSPVNTAIWSVLGFLSIIITYVSVVIFLLG
jgi:ABC-type transport system involved in cytochrome c biogenesis permease subunit